MMHDPMKVLAMPKTLFCLALAALSTLAGAQTQTPVAKTVAKPAGKTAGKPSANAHASAHASAQATAQAQARAAAEATAQAQAQAIAQAAASVQNLPRAPAQISPAAAAVQPAASAVQRSVPVMVPAYPAPVALPVSPAHNLAGPTFGTSAQPAMTPATPATPTSTPTPAPAAMALTAPASAVATAAAPVIHTHAATDLASDQMAIAGRVHQGQLPCEMGSSVRVEADAAKPGYFNVLGKGFKYHMHPVRTSTGAIRLEDAKAGAVWLQLANKSMLMDQTKGRRVADECAHPDQVAYAKGMKTNPPPSLFDTTGMGRPKN